MAIFRTTKPTTLFGGENEAEKKQQALRLERQCWTQAFKFHNLVRPQVVNVICKVINIAIILVGHYPSVPPGHDRMHERDGEGE
jgi:hypothetical protein